jgi:hypothetical protein
MIANSFPLEIGAKGVQYVSPGLTHKCWTRLKLFAGDKHSSLFCPTFSDEETTCLTKP